MERSGVWKTLGLPPLHWGTERPFDDGGVAGRREPRRLSPPRAKRLWNWLGKVGSHNGTRALRVTSAGDTPREAMGARLLQRQIGDVNEVAFSSHVFETGCFETRVDGKVLRWARSGPETKRRVATLFTKEPTTIAWLESMEPGELLVDVGANIGVYSVYAAMLSGVCVRAFEPEALNFAELNKNVYINGLHDRVTAYCLALGDEAAVGELYLGAFGYGYAHHDFNQNTWTKDRQVGNTAVPRRRRLRQGCVCARLDDLVAAGTMPCPDHIKIDVDGLEHRVLAGARRTLADPRLKTVLVEINFSDPLNRAIVDWMQEDGWRFSWDQVCAHRKGILTRDRVERMHHRGMGGLNYIFYRDDRYADLFAGYRRSYERATARS